MPPQKITVLADDQQYLIQVQDADLGDPPYEGGNGLIWVSPKGGMAIAHTGTDFGQVTVLVDVLPAAPATVDQAGWDDIVEVSVTFPSETLSVIGPHSYDDEDWVALPHGVAGHSWRLRIHARGRDLARDDGWDDPEEPLEIHLLQLWPAPPAADVVHKQTDRVGAEYRDR